MSETTYPLDVRLKRREEEALREFALNYGPRLFRLFRRRGLGQADAESLATSCITDAVLSVNSFQRREADSFDRWVYGLARRAWINDWRQSLRTEPLDEHQVAWPETPDWEDPFFLPVSQAVEASLAQLTSENQAVIRLHHFEGLPFAEVGQRLNTSEAAARVRHHRALKRLAALLERDPAVCSWRDRLFLTDQPKGDSDE